MIVHVVTIAYATSENYEILAVFREPVDAHGFVTRDYPQHQLRKRRSVHAPYVYEGFMSTVMIQEYEVE